MPDYFGAADLNEWTPSELFAQLAFFAEAVGNPGDFSNLQDGQFDGVRQVLNQINRRLDAIERRADGCDDIRYEDLSSNRPGTAWCGHCGCSLDICDCHDTGETPFAQHP